MTAPQRCVRFGLVIVGDEILSGKREDKHLSKVIELLVREVCNSPGRTTLAMIATP